MATSDWLNRTGIAPLFALMFGIGAAALVAAMLPPTFAAFASTTGLAGVGRPLAMLAAFVAAALPVWIATAVVERAVWPPRARPGVRTKEDETLDLEPFVEPVAVARGPIFAERDLGAPLMSDAALRTVAPIVDDPNESDTQEDRAASIDPLLEAADAHEVQAGEDASQHELEPVSETALDNERVGELLAQPLAAQEFDGSDEADTAPGETGIDALIRRLEGGLARRGAPAVDSAPAQLATVLRSEIARAAPATAGRTGPEDATARALQTLRQMAAG